MHDLYSHAGPGMKTQAQSDAAKKVAGMIFRGSP
jgi:hypothetical protein